MRAGSTLVIIQLTLANLNFMDIPQGPIQLPDLDYEQLEAPNAVDHNTIAQLDANIRHTNWMQTHYCIIEIRKIIKFQPNFTMDIVQRYSNAFVELFTNGKTQIIKNLLRMVKEIFDLGQQFNVEKAVYAFLPIILKKSSTDLGHIKEMSQQVLTSFAMNCGYDISFKMAAGFCLDKNIPMAELSIKVFAKLIEKVGNQIVQLNPDTLKDLMNSLEILIEGKRQNMQKQALDICMYLYNILGSENYLHLMNFALSPEQVITMGNAMQTHRVNKQKQHVPLANVLKARKTEIHMGMQNQNYDMNMNMNMNMGMGGMNTNMNMGYGMGNGYHQGMR